MKIRRTISIFCILAILLSLTGCLTVEQKEALADFEKEAAQYYKDKYGETPNIQKCDYYIDSTGIFPQRTDDMYARCKNGEYIIYDASRKLLVDNRQSLEASEAILAEFTARINEIAKTVETGEFKIENYNSSTYLTDLSDSNFYHAFYDGDIEKFMAAEDIQLSANLYLICDKEDSWQAAQQKCEMLIREDFRTDSSVSLVVLSRDCYDQKGISADIEYEGCWAKFSMDKESTDSYIQNYIKVSDGVYVTCAKENFVFEDGDVQMIEALTEQEINELILQRYNLLPDKAPENANGSYMVKDKTREKYSIVSASSPIYQITFSERVKNAFSSGKVAVYFTFKPDETNFADSDGLFKCTNNETIYRCVALTRESDNISSWTQINEMDYYFIGSHELRSAADTE